MEGLSRGPNGTDFKKKLKGWQQMLSKLSLYTLFDIYID